MLHRARSARASSLIGGVLLLVGLGLGGSIAVPQATEAAERTPDDELLHEIEFQLEADQVAGTDANGNDVDDGIDAWSEWVLAQLDVDDAEWPDRLNHAYTDPIAWYSLLLTASEVEHAEALFERWEGMGAFVSVERSRVMSIPITAAPETVDPAYFERSGEVVPKGLQRIGWVSPGTVQSGIAIIDTGVNVNHPDLNVQGGYNCVDRAADAGWGRDEHGHGTMMASIAAAEADSDGVVGVAPGAPIFAFQALSAEGSGSSASVMCAVNEAYFLAKEGYVSVLSLSLGGGGYIDECDGDDAMRNLFCRVAEIVPIVVSAGNSAADATSASPANYGDSVVAVGAWTDYDGQPGGFGLRPGDLCGPSLDDTPAYFSNWGTHVDVWSPGVCELAAYSDNAPGGDEEHQYARVSGTSPAAPFVAGAILNYVNANPDQGPETAIRQVLTFSREQVLGPDGTAAPLITGAEVPRWERPEDSPPGDD
jgi:subtilisin family serine protease